MKITQQFNEDQRERWNGFDGEYWSRQHGRLDCMLSPVTWPLLAFAAPAAGSTVLDVGCGCGGTTIALAHAVGPLGRVVGLDVSAPMLALAQERLHHVTNTELLLCDAAEIDLNDLRAELIFSRFGVMFFGDPTAAFANLRMALRQAGRLRFACWRNIEDNLWWHVPLKAVNQNKGDLRRHPEREEGQPGPFTFSDTARVRRILIDAGFTDPTFTPLDVWLDIAVGGTVDDAVMQLELGPAGALDSMRRALAPYASSGGVRLPAAVWLVAAERRD